MLRSGIDCGLLSARVSNVVAALALHSPWVVLPWSVVHGETDNASLSVGLLLSVKDGGPSVWWKVSGSGSGVFGR